MTARPAYAPTGAPPPVPAQNRVPFTAPFVPPTWSGTFQSKTFVRFVLSVTCFGVIVLIQWMRWSCHWKLPARSTTCQSGVAPGFAFAGTVPVLVRSLLR